MEEYQEIVDNELKGSETAVRKMLLYYISALQSNGVQDVKQYIASRISEMIDLSDEQYNFIITNLNQNGKIIDNLKNSIRLLSNIKETQKLDLESIEIVIKVLELIVNDYKDYQIGDS